jgi:hypothetical protein
VNVAAAGRPHLLWVATLDGTVDVVVPISGRLVAVQAFPASMTGMNADLSVVVDEAYWQGRSLP